MPRVRIRAHNARSLHGDVATLGVIAVDSTVAAKGGFGGAARRGLCVVVVAAGFRYDNVAGVRRFSKRRSSGVNQHFNVLRIEAAVLEVNRRFKRTGGFSARQQNGYVINADFNARFALIIRNCLADIHERARSGAAERLHMQHSIRRNVRGLNLRNRLRGHLGRRGARLGLRICDADFRAAVAADGGNGVVFAGGIVFVVVELGIKRNALRRVNGQRAAFRLLNRDSLFAADVGNHHVGCNGNCANAEIGGCNPRQSLRGSVGVHVDHARGRDRAASRHLRFRSDVRLCIGNVGVHGQTAERRSTAGRLTADGICGRGVVIGHDDAAETNGHRLSIRVENRLRVTGRFSVNYVDADTGQFDFKRCGTGDRVSAGLAVRINRDLVGIRAALEGSDVARHAAGDDHVRFCIIPSGAQRVALGSSAHRVSGIVVVQRRGNLDGTVAGRLYQVAAHGSLLRCLEEGEGDIRRNLVIVYGERRRVDLRLRIGGGVRNRLNRLAACGRRIDRAAAADADVRLHRRFRAGNSQVRAEARMAELRIKPGRRHVRNCAREDFFRFRRNGACGNLVFSRSCRAAGILMHRDRRFKLGLRVCEAAHQRSGNDARADIVDLCKRTGIALAQRIQFAGCFNGVRFNGSDGLAAAVCHGDVRRHIGHSARAGGQDGLCGILAPIRVRRIHIIIVVRHIGGVQLGSSRHVGRLQRAAFNAGHLIAAQNSDGNRSADGRVLCKIDPDHFSFGGCRARGKNGHVALAVKQVNLFAVRILRHAGFADHMCDVGRIVIGNRRIDIDGHATGSSSDSLCDSLRVGARGGHRYAVRLHVHAGHIDNGFVVGMKLHEGDARANLHAADRYGAEQGFSLRIHRCGDSDSAGIDALAQDTGHSVRLVDDHKNRAGHGSGASRRHGNLRRRNARHVAFNLDVANIQHARSGLFVALF